MLPKTQQHKTILYNTKISIPHNLSLILMKRQIPLILALSEKDGIYICTTFIYMAKHFIQNNF